MDIDYIFEEVAITLDGKEYLASGSVGVEFYMELSDVSVGFIGGAVINNFGRVIADLTDEDGEITMIIDAKNGPAVDAILNALDHDIIAIVCEESATSGW